jgi:hypothetical protein
MQLEQSVIERQQAEQILRAHEAGLRRLMARLAGGEWIISVRL